MRVRSLFPLGLFLLPGWLAFCSVSMADERLEFFEEKIRPVLVKHCYECHSSEVEEPSGSLVLDSADGWRVGGDLGQAVVPGKPDESPLLDALRYDGLEMPPDGRLPKQVAADFEKWIQDGAIDPRDGTIRKPEKPGIDLDAGRQFWAFRPITDPEVPQLDSDSQPASTIDAFVTARQTEAGVGAVEPADRETLIRRLYFDLTGLPPSVEDLERELANEAPDATDQLIDRLLASPQFGVHWGRRWLDVARYADSNGADFNATFHDAWRYRDYVVAAMNNDKPFDEFVREQIAGDLLPHRSPEEETEHLVATTYLMLGTKMLSERDKEKLRMDVVDEQIDLVSRSLLGLTVSCARCHDHKFDPIPTKDYYALAGIFRNTRTLEGESQRYVSTWRKTSLPASPERVAEVKAHAEEVKAFKAEIKQLEKDVRAAEAKRNAVLAERNPLLIDDARAELTGNWTRSTYSKPYFGTGYIHDDAKGDGKLTARFAVTLEHAGEYDVQVAYSAGPSRATPVPVTITGGDQTQTTTLNQHQPTNIEGRFRSIGRYRFPAGSEVAVTFTNEGTEGYLVLDAVRLVELDQKPKSATKPSDEANERLAKTDARIASLKDQLKTVREELKSTEQNAPAPLPRVMAATDLPKIEDTHIRLRGEHNRLGERVPRGFPQVATTGTQTPLPSEESGRRQLAEWIVGPDNPLTARVIVNRVWSQLMGQGIVRSVDNFGTLGERPTHPQLLDHLAARFRQPTDPAADYPGFGWSLKSLIREIVCSDTYQRATVHDDTFHTLDPENRWLWRANRRRIPAEAMRDAMLAIDGSLDLSPGGSPVSGLGVLVNNNQPGAKSANLRTTNRRTLYLPIIRNELPSILTVFDFADPDFVVGRRPVTNVPAQALFLMNSPEVIESADRTANRLATTHPTVSPELVTAVYRSVLSRTPRPHEIKRGIDFLTGSDSTGEQPVPMDSGRLALFVHALYASTEFRMLD